MPHLLGRLQPLPTNHGGFYWFDDWAECFWCVAMFVKYFRFQFIILFWKRCLSFGCWAWFWKGPVSLQNRLSLRRWDVANFYMQCRQVFGCSTNFSMWSSFEALLSQQSAPTELTILNIGIYYLAHNYWHRFFSEITFVYFLVREHHSAFHCSIAGTYFFKYETHYIQWNTSSGYLGSPCLILFLNPDLSRHCRCRWMSHAA